MLGKAVAPPTSAPQRLRQEAFYGLPGCQSENTLFHTTRAIKYVFLDGSQNTVQTLQTSPSLDSSIGHLESAKSYYYPLVLPDHSLASSYWLPDLERLPIFVTLSKSQEKLNGGWGRPHFSRDRLPVFRKLCGETTATATHRREDLKAAKNEPGMKSGGLEERGLGEKPEMEKENQCDDSAVQPILREWGIQL